MKKLLTLLIIIVVIIAVATIVFFVSCRGGSGEDVVITIPAGAGLNQISEILSRENIVSSARSFRRYASNQNNIMFQQGDHVLNGNMSYAEIIEVLQRIPQPIIPDGTERVTIPEGFELRNIVDRLYSRGLIDRDRFMREVENGVFDFDFVRAIPTANRIHRLEGYLFPATYDILPTHTEWDIINMMLQAFESNVIPVYNRINPTQTLDEIVIMASIVEREAVNNAERPTIAGVFYNRIRIGMLLQSCATVKYTFDLGTRPAVLSIAQTRMDSPYNTYMHAGLPVGPIASPGLLSLQAAMEWETHDYIYFTANIDGTGHVFSRTLAEHNAASREREQAHRNRGQ
ncbi:MAG: endolytic transglycosylase MltG [Oscillospiraceae bacterium]|nr:endolytic transglycosylase MltG [Oscillospiraceae bacterium]